MGARVPRCACMSLPVQVYTVCVYKSTCTYAYISMCVYTYAYHMRVHVQNLGQDVCDTVGGNYSA